MRVLSTNIGKPTTYEFNGATVRSSMRRQPTLGGLQVYFDHIEGDKFGVPKLHGTMDSIVYAFSAATFEDLSRLYTQPVGAGNVGENLTMDDIKEADLMIGDDFGIGETILRVEAPRYPCNRLNFCFQRENAMELFADYRRPGVYFKVMREGRIRAGDELKLVKSAGGDLSILQLFDALKTLKDVSKGKLARADVKVIAEKVVRNVHVPLEHRERFAKFL
jgi:MOSC domain-containing protein YiiM